MPKLIDLTGQKFGYWTVLKYVGNSLWQCRCECGTEAEIDSYSLRSGNSHSCGCYQKEVASKTHRKHGFTRKRLYRIYYKMKERCYKPTNDNYKYYGGLGITICDEWLNSFPKFAEWALANGYADNLTIDRKDNTKGYSPDNCRWITIQEQQGNRRKKGTIYGSK